MQLPAASCLPVEDSKNGVRAAGWQPPEEDDG